MAETNCVPLSEVVSKFEMEIVWRSTDYEKIQIGMIVEIDEKEFSVTSVEKTPVPVDESITEYAKHVGTLIDGEWIHYIYTDCPAELEGEVFPAKIIIERIHPLYFVTN